MKKIILFIFIISFLFIASGCAPRYRYNSLEEFDEMYSLLEIQYDELQNEYDELQNEYDELQNEYNEYRETVTSSEMETAVTTVWCFIEGEENISLSEAQSAIDLISSTLFP